MEHAAATVEGAVSNDIKILYERAIVFRFFCGLLQFFMVSKSIIAFKITVFKAFKVAPLHFEVAQYHF